MAALPDTPARPASASPPVRCLVVDDLDGNLVSLRALLQDHDLEVVTARSGPEALEHLLAGEFALVLLDVHMPEMDGFEVAELMRGNPRTRHVPIIFITAGGADRRRVFQGYGAGAVDFLHKPVDADILKSKVGVFMELYRQRRRVAEELQERTRTLELAEMFMAVLGHDLRSPLASVMVGAQVLANNPGADVAGVSAMILRGGARMQRMIDDLLDVARVRLGQGLPLQPQHCDLGALAAEVVLERRAAWPGRAVETRGDGDLGGRWDAERLRQLLANLLGNALQHGAADVPVRLELDGGAHDGVRLTVSNGGAIPPDVQATLFDPFRAAGTRTREQGLGLGFYIVQQIALAHGGRIEVSSGAGAGTRVSAWLPRGR